MDMSKRKSRRYVKRSKVVSKTPPSKNAYIFSISILVLLAVLTVSTMVLPPETTKSITLTLSSLMSTNKLDKKVNFSSNIVTEKQNDNSKKQLSQPNLKYLQNAAEFSPTFQKQLEVKKIFLEGRRIAPVELLPQNNISRNHSVR